MTRNPHLLTAALIAMMTPAIVSQKDEAEKRDQLRDDNSHLDRASRRRIERLERKANKALKGLRRP